MSYLPLSGTGRRVLLGGVLVVWRKGWKIGKTRLSFAEWHRDRNEVVWGGGYLWQKSTTSYSWWSWGDLHMKKACSSFCCVWGKKRAVSFPHLLENFHWIFVGRLSSPHVILCWPAIEGWDNHEQKERGKVFLMNFFPLFPLFPLFPFPVFLSSIFSIFQFIFQTQTL